VQESADGRVHEEDAPEGAVAVSEKVGIYIEPDGPCRNFVSDSSMNDSPVCSNCGWLYLEHEDDDTIDDEECEE